MIIGEITSKNMYQHTGIIPAPHAAQNSTNNIKHLVGME